MQPSTTAFAIALAWFPHCALAVNYLDLGNHAANFTWSNASDEFGQFGQPVSNPSQDFIAFPVANFLASTEGGASDTDADSLSIDIAAGPGYRISGVNLRFQGDYSLDGAAGGQVSAEGLLAVVSSQPSWERNESYLLTQTQNGNNVFWSSITEVVVPFNVPVTQATVTVDHMLEAISTSGGSAEIGSFVLLDVNIDVPEPAMLPVMIFLAATIPRRRPNRLG